VRFKWTPLIVASLIAAGAPTTALAQPQALTCKEFVAMPEADQLLFIKGMEEGIGVAFGVASVFAKGLDATATTPGEKAAIQKMEAMPRGFMGRARMKMGIETVQAVIAKCATNQIAGLAYVDAVSGK
jgi:hypothetical protein